MAVLPPDPVHILRSGESWNCLCIHQNERIFAGAKKGVIALWDLHTNRCSYQIKISDAPIIGVRHTDDTLIAQEKGGRTSIRRLTNSGYTVDAELALQHSAFCRIDTARELLVAPKLDAAVEVIDLHEAKVVRTLVDPDWSEPLGTVGALKLVEVSGKTYLLAGYESGAMLMWELASGRVVSSAKFDEFITSIDYDPLTNRGICGGASAHIQVFTLDRATLSILKKTDLAIKNAGVHCLKIRKDLKVFAAGGWDGRIRIFSWKSLRPLAVLTEHRGELMDIAYSDDKVAFWKAPIMAAASADGQITLWDIYN